MSSGGRVENARVLRGLLFWVGAALIGSCAGPPPAPAVSSPEAPSGARAEFERLRVAGGFTRDAYVVWSPVWPTANDEVTVLYDARAPLARFHDASLLQWFLTPESGDGIARAVSAGGDGVGVVRARAADLAPGWFSFGAGKERDNNCGNPWKLPIVPKSPAWHEAKSAHFVYRWLDGDPVASKITDALARLEAHLAVIVDRLGLALPKEPVVYLHYATRDLGHTYQAHHGNNADEFRHLVFSAEDVDDAHELTHLLINEQLARHHTGLFDEGIATYFGQELTQGTGWQGRSCDSWARDGIATNDLPSLASIAAASTFYSVPWNKTGGVLYYGAACSFARELLERHGAAKLRALLGSISCETQDDFLVVEDRFRNAFGVSLQEADLAWRKRLAGH
jgi:hypothetical protein